MTAPRALAVFAAGLVLAACAAAGGPESLPASLDLGSNLVGETCRAQPDAAPTGATGLTIHCGRWEQPSARLVRVAAGTAAAGPAQSA